MEDNWGVGPIKEMAQFGEYIGAWCDSLPVLLMGQAIPQPEKAAILSVDVINGFCNIGPLASPRVAGIVGPIVSLFERAWERGVHNIVLSQDTHEPAAVEFGSWPVHCVRGSHESDTVPEIKALPFYDQMAVFPKNSINPGLSSGLADWMARHQEVENFVVVGDCTDLCTYQLAMHVRLDANSRQLSRRVIVPANCTDTYDLPVDTAIETGAPAHPGEFFHRVFLYHMAMNGVEVVQSIAG